MIDAAGTAGAGGPATVAFLAASVAAEGYRVVAVDRGVEDVLAGR